jgi:hypothetical protein
VAEGGWRRPVGSATAGDGELETSPDPARNTRTQAAAVVRRSAKLLTSRPEQGPSSREIHLARDNLAPRSWR